MNPIRENTGVIHEHRLPAGTVLPNGISELMTPTRGQRRIYTIKDCMLLLLIVYAVSISFSLANYDYFF